MGAQVRSVLPFWIKQVGLYIKYTDVFRSDIFAVVYGMLNLLCTIIVVI